MTQSEPGSEVNTNTPREVVRKMYEKDRFSRFLGINVEKVTKGHCTLSMKIRDDMINGFGIAHGGVTFALGDSALAFASNSHGRVSVALEASISYPIRVNVGDTLTARADEVGLTNRVGVYTITISNQEGKIVGLFKGTVYRTSTLYLQAAE